MKLSDLREGDVGKFPVSGRRFIVTSRTAEDRSSGSTRITMESGGTMDYLWDQEDPEVKKIGRGRLVTKIIMENGA
jgi:hypothetical protein